MMIQRSREQTIRSGKRVVLGALVAGLVLGGLALHLSAETTRADCLSINGATISFGNGDGTCASSVGGSAMAQSSSSVSSSTNGSQTSSTTVVSQSSNGGDATAVVSSGNSSGGSIIIQNSDGTVSIQNSDGTYSVIGTCPAGIVAAGQTLVLGSGTVCASSPTGQTISTNSGGALSLSQSGSAVPSSGGASCGSPSMVLGPAGISMSSGSC